MDVVGDVLSKREVEPDDVSFMIFGPFNFVFIFII